MYYEKILVPLDGSELAEVALPYAEQLAGKLGSEIILLHVSGSTERSYDQLPDMYYIKKKVEATWYGAQTYPLKSAETEVKVESEIVVGNPAEAIVEYVDKKDIALIIMATHGRTGIRRWALGSVADKVVRAINRPVMLIRARDAHTAVCERGMLTKILVPLDGSAESEAVIPYVRELGSKLKAEIVLFESVPRIDHVYGAEMTVARVPYTDEEMEPLKAEAEVYLERVGNLLKDSGITLGTEVTIGDAAEEIIKLSDKIPVDMVAMSTHGRSGISRWSLGSVAIKVLHAGNTPLLLVKMHQS